MRGNTDNKRCKAGTHGPTKRTTTFGVAAAVAAATSAAVAAAKVAMSHRPRICTNLHQNLAACASEADRSPFVQGIR